MSKFRTSAVTFQPKHPNRMEHSRWVAVDVLNEISRLKTGAIFFVGTFGPIRIEINKRHRLFASSFKCMFCDLNIEVACIERTASNPNEAWHLQFYGIKNKQLVLFTVDHIVPRSLGGKDHIKNRQTACQGCNVHKGDVCTDPFAAAKIRYRGTYE